MAKPRQQKYSDDSISTAKGFDHIRIRTTHYIHGRGARGQWHITKEIIDNAVDEATLKKEQGLITITFCRDVVNNKYNFIITDNGRGVPINKLLSAFTVLHTSGKFNEDAYGFSSGSFGVGAKVTAGLSKCFRAITYRDNKLGSVIVKDGQVPKSATIEKHVSPVSGTTVLFSPDSSVFKEIDQFIDTEYLQVLQLLKIFDIFSEYRTQFNITDVTLPDEVWDMPTKKLLPLLTNFIKNSTTIYDSYSNREDPDKFIKEHFQVLKNWSWNARFTHDLSETNKELSFDIKAFSVRYDDSFAQLSLVNSVPIASNDSYHITNFINSIKRRLLPLIDNKDMHNYFMSNYKLPMYICMNIKFRGAEFTGAHKDLFKDDKFRTPYVKALASVFNKKEFDSVFKNYYSVIESDLKSKYEYSIYGSTKQDDSKGILSKLNHPNKFNDCTCEDRQNAELILAEGESAGGKSNRDSSFQGTYDLRGKPINVLTDKDPLASLNKNKIIQDIKTIMNLRDGQEDFSNLNFGKLIINTDADIHGDHIVCILLVDLLVSVPKFVESGRLYVILAPLYCIRFSGSKNKEGIFLFKEEEVTSALAEYVYHQALDVHVHAPKAFNKPKLLTKEEFIQFTKIVIHVGNMLEKTANEHAMHPAILEMLTHVSHYLTPKTFNLEVIKNFLNLPVTYDPTYDILGISIGREDYHISLKNLQDSLYSDLIPFLNKIQWRETQYLVTSKFTDNYRKTPMNLYQIYQQFLALDKLFTIERYKGLGSMSKEDHTNSCMNPDKRKLMQITSIGDVKRVMEIMGKSTEGRVKMSKELDPWAP